jgi:hypothetical protein
MKIKSCVSIFSAFVVGWLLVCGVSVIAQDLTVNGNVNLQSNPPTYPGPYFYQINGNPVLRVFRTLDSGSHLFLGVGSGALINPTDPMHVGYPNTFLGNFAGNHDTDKSSEGGTFVGYAAGSNNVNGSGNTYIGYKAAGFHQSDGFANSSGSANTFVGYQSGWSLTSGNANTFVGNYSGPNTTTGTGNVFIGYSAGTQNTTGSWNIFIGTSGQGAGQGDHSNIIRIGDPTKQTAAYFAGIWGQATTPGVGVSVVYIDANGKLGTSVGVQSPQEMIEAQRQQIADLEQRVSRLEALIQQK